MTDEAGERGEGGRGPALCGGGVRQRRRTTRYVREEDAVGQIICSGRIRMKPSADSVEGDYGVAVAQLNCWGPGFEWGKEMQVLRMSNSGVRIRCCFQRVVFISRMK